MNKKRQHVNITDMGKGYGQKVTACKHYRHGEGVWTKKHVNITDMGKGYGQKVTACKHYRHGEGVWTKSDSM